MSFRARMQVQHSRAEEQVDKMIHQRGFAKHFMRNILIFYDTGEACYPERTLTAELIGRKFTIPDFTSIDARFLIYVDGVQAHKSRGAKRRDARRVELEDYGWSLLVVEHSGVIPQKTLDKIKGQIEKEVKAK